MVACCWVSPTGPQLPATPSNAINAAAATTARIAVIQPGRRGTGVPAKSRRRRIGQEPPRQAAIQATLTMLPSISGP